MYTEGGSFLVRILYFHYCCRTKRTRRWRLLNTGNNTKLRSHSTCPLNTASQSIPWNHLCSFTARDPPFMHPVSMSVSQNRSTAAGHVHSRTHIYNRFRCVFHWYGMTSHKFGNGPQSAVNYHSINYSRSDQIPGGVLATSR